MDFDTVLLGARRADSIARGLWHDRTINDHLDACVAACPDKVALKAVSLDAAEVGSFSYRELATLADRIAVGLSRLGVGRNDVVAMQLPNWRQFSLLYLACSRIGAVVNPLMPIFRERELSFMLTHGEAKLLVVPKIFRNFDHEAMARGLQPTLPHLKRIVVVDGGGADDFEALLTKPEWEKEPDAQAILTGSRPSADDVTQLIYTSGTTGEPKGVMHTANTLMANIVPYAERLRLGADDVILMASPMAHQTGFMYGLLMPIMLKASAVLQDVWDPARAAALIRAEKVTFTMASTPFLTDLSRVVTESGEPVPTLRVFLCAGAPIPGPLVEQAQAGLGAKIVSAWGMTENGAVTLINLDDDDRLASTTDGCPLPGVEVRALDPEGKTLPAGEIGKLVVRACSNFGGYLKRPQWNATDDDGWFDTGDLAYTTADGYIRITGRSKDVIIRGGENIASKEVEDLLAMHPAVLESAAIGRPDPRYGERVMVYVILRPDHDASTFDLGEVQRHFAGLGVAKQKTPEFVEVVSELPRGMSGKVKKFELRSRVRNIG